MTSDLPDTRVTFRTWIGFSLLCLGMFMAILDIQIVVTSLPAISKALGISAEDMSWVQTSYLIAEIVAIPLTGYLTRLLGMRRLFVLAVSIFAAASAGCAASHSLPMLLAFRVLQGFAGGTLIPTVFSAVFILFPKRLQGRATTLTGLMAVLAPTVGPIAGGWLTQSYSWHWLFLVNILPGVVAAIGAAATLPREPIDKEEARSLDALALILLAVALTALEIGLKDAPDHGWGSVRVLALIAAFAIGGTLFVVRTLRAAHPLVDLTNFADRNFVVGCILSFVLGIGLFGMTYLMPFFLALVRGHNALEIGEIMLVTGVTQLLVAPVAVALERRVDPRFLTFLGFVLFAGGAWVSAHQTSASDFHEMIVPQIMRGAASMFCLLPPVRLALGALPPSRVADASGLFNLMRNIGGAIGLALIDTVIFTRSASVGRHIVERLKAGDADMAVSIGIPRDIFLAQAGQPLDAETTEMVRPLIEKAALVTAINDAWLLVSLLTVAAVLLVPLVRKVAEGEAPPLH